MRVKEGFRRFESMKSRLCEIACVVWTAQQMVRRLLLGRPRRQQSLALQMRRRREDTVTTVCLGSLCGEEVPRCEARAWTPSLIVRRCVECPPRCLTRSGRLSVHMVKGEVLNVCLHNRTVLSQSSINRRYLL